MNRRAWMRGIAAFSLWPTTPSFAQEMNKADERELAAVLERAQAAKLDAVRSSTMPHYLGVGDCSTEFRTSALRLCEDLAGDYIAHFRNKKGFSVELPKRRLTVVTLAEPASFAAFLGEPADEAVGGIYDLDTNRLVIFDNRARGGEQAERANTISLLHEATHQLTFNTGLLDRSADVPLAISEGLACYGEVRRPGNKAKVGDVNTRRVAVLKAARAERKPWMEARSLFADDAPFDDPETEQLAYAHSWLLVSHLLKSTARPSPFQSYLKMIKGRKTKEKRLADAEAAFGPLDALDKELKSYLARIGGR